MFVRKTGWEKDISDSSQEETNNSLIITHMLIETERFMNIYNKSKANVGYIGYYAIYVQMGHDFPQVVLC